MLNNAGTVRRQLWQTLTHLFPITMHRLLSSVYICSVAFALISGVLRKHAQSVHHCLWITRPEDSECERAPTRCSPAGSGWNAATRKKLNRQMSFLYNSVTFKHCWDCSAEPQAALIPLPVLSLYCNKGLTDVMLPAALALHYCCRCLFHLHMC